MFKFLVLFLACVHSRTTYNDIDVLPLQDVTRVRRTTTGMCSASMANIQRLARFTATMLVKSSNTKRSGRAAKGTMNMINQNPGRFCLSIWRSLKIVKDDLVEIEKPLVKSKGTQSVELIKSSIEQMREALQEQMNMYGVRFHESEFHKKTMQRVRQSGKIGHIRNRAEVRMSNISKKLDSVNVACNRYNRRRRNN